MGGYLFLCVCIVPIPFFSKKPRCILVIYINLFLSEDKLNGRRCSLCIRKNCRGPICWQASEVVTHCYEANDTSFINIVFLRFAPNIYIYQSIYTFIYRAKQRASEGAGRHHDLLFSLAVVGPSKSFVGFQDSPY